MLHLNDSQPSLLKLLRLRLLYVVNGVWSINAALTMHLSRKCFIVHDHPEPGLHMLECSFDYFCQR